MSTISLAELPMFFALTGIVVYAVLAGADFGAGIWQLLAGRGERAKRIRDHAHHSMSPVWEANHVWLIFVLVVVWTAYPQAFASIASTLAIALAVAGLGIILRGTAYALRSGTENDAETRVVDTLAAVGSLMTPFALAAAAGGIASQRVPVGNARGDLLSSWLNPTSLMAGLLAIIASAYLAAVYLAADARREGESDLAASFRARALTTGLLAGAVAGAGALVVRSDARWIFDRLIGTPAVLSVSISVLAGAATLILVARHALDAARATAAIAVAGVVGGWALAQNPVLLPALTVTQAAAPASALIPLVIAIVAGGFVLFPALAILFRLALGGAFSAPARTSAAQPTSRPLAARHAIGTGRAAIVMLAIGTPVLVIGDAAWTRVVGVTALCAFVLLGFTALDPGAAEHDDTLR